MSNTECWQSEKREQARQILFLSLFFLFPIHGLRHRLTTIGRLINNYFMTRARVGGHGVINEKQGEFVIIILYSTKANRVTVLLKRLLLFCYILQSTG